MSPARALGSVPDAGPLSATSSAPAVAAATRLGSAARPVAGQVGVEVGQRALGGGLALLAADRVEQLVLLVGELALDAPPQAALDLGQRLVAAGQQGPVGIGGRIALGGRIAVSGRGLAGRLGLQRPLGQLGHLGLVDHDLLDDLDVDLVDHDLDLGPGVGVDRLDDLGLLTDAGEEAAHLGRLAAVGGRLRVVGRVSGRGLDELGRGRRGRGRGVGRCPRRRGPLGLLGRLGSLRARARARPFRSGSR